MTTTLLETDMSGWAEVTNHYQVGPDEYIAVEASPTDNAELVPTTMAPMVDEVLMTMGNGRAATKNILRPTMIFQCDVEGTATDLTPLFTFPPGTTHNDALVMGGYELAP